MELFCQTSKRYEWCKSNTGGASRNTIDTMKHHAVGALFMCRDWGSAQILLKGQWMGTNTTQYFRRTSSLLWTYGWGESSSFRMTVTPSVRPKRHWNGWKTERWVFWRSWVEAPIVRIHKFSVKFSSVWQHSRSPELHESLRRSLLMCLICRELTAACSGWGGLSWPMFIRTPLRLLLEQHWRHSLPWWSSCLG